LDAVEPEVFQVEPVADFVINAEERAIDITEESPGPIIVPRVRQVDQTTELSAAVI